MKNYEVKMRRFKMDLGEHIDGLNHLRGANLSDAWSEHRISKWNIHEAKKSLKKYFGSSWFSNNPTQCRHPVALVTPKQESLFT